MSNSFSEKKRKVLNAPSEEVIKVEDTTPIDTESVMVDPPVVGNWESGSKEVSKKAKDTLKHNQDILPPAIVSEVNSSHPGNPGQQARFNHVMDNRGPETSKYFK